MNKIKQWFWTNRAPIGYSIGGANLISGLANIYMGSITLGVFWIAIGAFIIFDVKTYK